jgi:tetratricopeptide (TPR) repeat protein
VADGHKYRAFLSYSHRDLKWADRLHRELERYRVPPHLRQTSGAERPLPRNLRPIFRDRDDLSGGASLPNIIHDALVDSEALIVICSPSAVDSDWVNEEIRTFQRLGRHDRIFCVIVDGEPGSGDKQECFPKALLEPVDPNDAPMEHAGEPIAADLRGGRQDSQHGKMMLIAGLLGVGLDELLQRDHHRRTRRLFAMTTATTLLALIMAGLMIFAFMARSEAERRRADAENLISFMLGDLREDLHAINRLDLFNSVSAKAMEYFRSLGAEGAREEVLAKRAQALIQIGESRLDQADMPSALEAFQESLEINMRLVIKNPDRVDWNLALAESHFYVGKVHWQRHEFTAAAEKFQQQLAIVDALASVDPDNTERLSHSGFAWTNYGRVLELDGRYEEALQAYEKVMAIFQHLQVLQPDDADARLEVGFAHNNLGKLKMSFGLLAEAVKHFRNDVLIKQQVVSEYPNHNLWRGYLAVSHTWLGRALSSNGALKDASEQGERALMIFDSLIESEPSMMPLKQRRARALKLLAVNCRLQKNSECAASYISAALADLDEITSVNPENVQWQRDLSACKLEAAWQAAIAGQIEFAQELAESVVESTRPTGQEELDDRETVKLYMTALLTRGDLARKTYREDEAAAAWQAVLNILDTHFPASRDPEVMDISAKLMARAGNIAVADDTRETLQRMSYQSPYPWL